MCLNYMVRETFFYCHRHIDLLLFYYCCYYCNHSSCCSYYYDDVSFHSHFLLNEDESVVDDFFDIDWAHYAYSFDSSYSYREENILISVVAGEFCDDYDTVE